MTMSRREVLIAIPAHDWRVNVVLATFVYNLLARSSDPTSRLRFSISVAPDVSPVHYARNLLVGIFLKETRADHLWFIDNDMMPDDSSLALFDADADIVSGRCLATRPGPEGLRLAVAAYDRRNPETGEFTGVTGDAGEPGPIVAAGTANLLIRRAVLADPRMQQEPHYVDLAGRTRSVLDDQEFAPPVFRTRYKPNGQVLLGEDIDFVYRASQLGYRCLYHPAARMGHLKTVDLNSVEQMVARMARPVGGDSSQSPH